MKEVNCWYVHALLSPLVGLADDDESVVRYSTLNPNEASEVKQVIRSILKPYFERYDQKSMDKARDSLSYYLSKDNTDFDRIFYSNLLPFNAPDDPRTFFVWLWDELFGASDYQIHDFTIYQVNEDVAAANSIKLNP